MKKLLLLFLPLAALLAGCEKEGSYSEKDETPGNGKLINMINMTIMEKDGEEYSTGRYNLQFAYDENIRLAEIRFVEVYENEESIENLSFTYFKDEIYSDYAGGTIFKFKEERVVSLENEYWIEKYFYDAKGMLNQTQYIQGNSTYTTIYERSEGDIIKIYGPKGERTEIVYSGYKDKMNLDLWEFYSSGPLIAEYAIDRTVFKNIGSTKLPASIKTEYGDTIELFYEFDKEGYPVKIKSVWSDGLSSDYIRILTISYDK